MKTQVINIQLNLLKISISMMLTLSIFSAISQGSWTQKADWTGCYAQSNTAVSVGDKAYVGLGTAYCRDWREFDPINNTWTPMDTLPSIYSETNMAFGINNKAYVLTSGGYINNNNTTYDYQNELWEYDPSNGDWTYLNNLPSNPINQGTSFSINGKGYIVGGSVPSMIGTFSIELWEYDPLNNTWTNKAPYIGVPTACQVAFVIDGMAYIGGGMTSGSVIPSEFYKYNPNSNQWSQIATCPKTELFAASSFAVNGKGYVGMGLSLGTTENPHYVWEYNPLNDVWNRVEDLPDNQCMWDEGIGFSINGKGYMGLGDVTCNQLPMGYYPYIYEYTPVSNSINTFENNIENIKVFPNPSSEISTIKIRLAEKMNIKLIITNIIGEMVEIINNGVLYSGEHHFQWNNSDFAAGIYLLQLSTPYGTEIKKIVVDR